jgi:tRNA-modifying protein YgfZ
MIAKILQDSILSLMKIPEDAAVFRYRPSCVLRVNGPDAGVFLQGQFTNDLGKMTSGQSVYGLWLDRRGRVVGDSHVILTEGVPEYRIVSMGSLGASIAGHLGNHIIADEVEVFDETPEWGGVALIGKGTGSWLASAPRAGLVFPGRRDSAENWEWVHPLSESASADEALAGVATASANDMERARILAGIPSVPADIGPSDIPNEGGLDACAISYSKGCYIGQEVVARVKALGRVRRKLVLVSGIGDPPALLSSLWQGGRKEGELRSAAPSKGGYVGLALVSVTSASAGGPFSLGPGVAPSVQIALPP